MHFGAVSCWECDEGGMDFRPIGLPGANALWSCPVGIVRLERTDGRLGFYASNHEERHPGFGSGIDSAQRRRTDSRCESSFRRRNH